MAFKTLSSLDADTTISLGGYNKKLKKENPEQVEGYFLGTRKVPSKLAKSGECDLHVFQTAKGNVGVWGKSDMDKKLRQVTPGTMTRVQFTGTKPTKAGSDMYLYSIAVDDENTIEVVGNSTSNDASEQLSPGQIGADYYDDIEDNASHITDEEESVPPAPQAIAPQQVNNDRAAKVAALLKGKKPA